MMRDSNRRDFLKKLSVAPVALSSGKAALEEERSAPALRDFGLQSRPNILVLMSDNHSWRHLGCYGDPVVRTPTIDGLAERGTLFTHAYCSTPSCTPARASMLAGQDPWRLEDGANLWGAFPSKFPIYTDRLAAAGYHVGCEGKAWGPGNVEMSGRVTNHGGPRYDSLAEFLEANTEGKPWTYWYSSKDPHRPFVVGSGEAAGLDPDDVVVPDFMPDTPEVRGDMLDYYHEVEQFDQEVAGILEMLERSGETENTLILVCSDNGWQMPRGLANLYDHGTRIPLIAVWAGHVAEGTVVNDMISLNDFAPTFLELGGVPIPEQMTAKSFAGVLLSRRSGRVDQSRDRVYMGRERHALCRQYGKSYPMRGIRTHDYLYIWNMDPEGWPAGDPPLYGDVDPNYFQYPGPAKLQLIQYRDDPKIRPMFELAFAKRPPEELYDLRSDPDQVNNVAADPAYAEVRTRLANDLKEYLIKTEDPRIVGGTVVFDTAMYYNGEVYTVSPGEEAQRILGLEDEYKFFLPLSEGINVGTEWTRSTDP